MQWKLTTSAANLCVEYCVVIMSNVISVICTYEEKIVYTPCNQHVIEYIIII